MPIESTPIDTVDEQGQTQRIFRLQQVDGDGRRHLPEYRTKSGGAVNQNGPVDFEVVQTGQKLRAV